MKRNQPPITLTLPYVPGETPTLPVDSGCWVELCDKRKVLSSWELGCRHPSPEFGRGQRWKYSGAGYHTPGPMACQLNVIFKAPAHPIQQAHVALIPSLFAHRTPKASPQLDVTDLCRLVAVVHPEVSEVVLYHRKVDGEEWTTLEIQSSVSTAE